MSSTLKVVAVSGSVQRPTRTLVLLKALIAGLAQKLPIELHLIELSEVGPQFAGVLRREDLPAAVEADLQAIGTMILNHCPLVMQGQSAFSFYRGFRFKAFWTKI